MAIVQRSEDALAQIVLCGGIEWVTKRKRRKPILPKNDPGVSVVYTKAKKRKYRTMHSLGAATHKEMDKANEQTVKKAQSP